VALIWFSSPVVATGRFVRPAHRTPVGVGAVEFGVESITIV
jgi:hypothetical protein